MANTNRTTEEWLALYRRQRESGKTLKTWCAENNVNQYTMADRVSRLRKAGAINEPKPHNGGHSAKQAPPKQPAPPSPMWVEAIRSGALSEEPSENICVRIGKFHVTVPVRFQEAAFLRVCKALASLC